MDGTRVLLAAHRGDRKFYPENTMPAFQAAHRAGVDMIETDIRMTADGHLVVIHDRSSLRTTGVDRPVNEMTLAEVKELDAGHLFSVAFSGTRVPTVQEFLEWVSKTELLVNWELKDYPGETGEEHAFACTDRLLAMIAEYGMENRSMVNSFSNRILEYIWQKQGHRFPIHGQGIYHCPRYVDRQDAAVTELFDWCCLWPNGKTGSPLDNPENFEYCLQNGVIPCLCIPDKAEDYEKALRLGCRMFTSNDIHTADQILRSLGVR